jgi:hypothetical protein
VLIKIVQLVMACAIFNPFCCCTAAVLIMDDVERAPFADGCCQSQSSELPADRDANQQHDITQCPHAALQDYEAVSQKHLNAANDGGTLLPALLVVCELLAVEPSTQVPFPVTAATISHAPPLPFAQVYCIYRV